MAYYDVETTRVVLDGSHTLRNAGDTHLALSNMIIETTALEIDCSGVNEVDLSFVQFLLATKASAIKAGKTFNLAHPATGALHSLLERGGFLSSNAQDLGFWTKTESP